jgi:hypothetical protein
MMLAPCSPIIMAGAFVFPPVMAGMIEASTTRSPSTPSTRSSGSTTARSSRPIRHVPTAWYTEVARFGTSFAKNPSHLFALAALPAAYPDTLVIQTHRSPRTTIASACSLVAGTMSSA